ncbi:MAG TPA: hypothetical protein VFC19_43050 [Candidatus Limnocylindrales bacterium]|nr:hypothetical protein [Candidatus Limnocylindrales bacterium]
MRRFIKRVMVVALVVGSVSAASPATAQPQIQALPSPLRFVSNLDLECFRTSPYTPPAIPIVTKHLNPALSGLPTETVILGPREKLCVPVAKRGAEPTDDVIDFVRYVDLSCYRIQGINVNQPLTLRHLNPLFATSVLPKNVVITIPQHLCLPVIKNGVVPPPEVLRLVQYIDLKCYLAQPQTSLHKQVFLTHLNRVLAHLPGHFGDITFNRQLCVPVQKAVPTAPAPQPIPLDVLNIVRWIDIELYDLATPAIPPQTLFLRHINPALPNLPGETAVIQQAFQIGLPVAKNNFTPPPV